MKTKLLYLLLIPGVLMLPGAGWAVNCASVSQHGITWTFSASVECGQFVNGDWWVVAPVTINSTTPAPTAYDNGSVVDPVAGATNQPFHGNTTQYWAFDNTLRPTFPLTVSSGVKSLVSTITVGPGYNNSVSPKSFVDNAAVLTIVTSAPTATSFRPRYVSGDKTIYDSASITYTNVPSYAPPGTIIDHTNKMRMPWLDYGPKTVGEENTIPINDTGGNVYPGDRAKIIGQVSMLMMLNTANRTTYINRMVQFGIDQYGIAVGNNNAWQASGGYGTAHLWPIIFAGALLGDNTILSVPRYTTSYPTMRKFSEQGYTYYNDNNTAMLGSDECAAGAMPYPPTACSNVMCRPQDNTVGIPAGFPENYWGECGGGYRYLVSATYAGQALAARILEPTLGAMTKFSHPAFFDYMDYYSTNCTYYDGSVCTTDAIRDSWGFGGTGNGFMKYMWDTYRGAIADTTPAAFSFTDNTGVARSTVIYSTSVQVTAIDNTTSIALSGAGCAYRVNAGSWITSGDNVTLNDNVALRVTSSGSYSTNTPCTLNLGGVTDTWNVTTLAAVADPVAPRMRGSSMSGGWR